MATFKDIPKGAQVLLLPIDNAAITAGYRNKLYSQQFGFEHYGVDMVSTALSRSVFALGDGEVIAAGLDGAKGEYSGLGWVTVIRYNNVYIHSQNKVVDLIATTMHHQADLFVEQGDKVTNGQVLGYYSNTGGTLVNGQRMGAHLHLQFDTDVDFPLYCYGIGGSNSQILKKGTVNSTVNPFDVLWRLPDEQSCVLRNPGWGEDWSQIPVYIQQEDPEYPTECLNCSELGAILETRDQEIKDLNSHIEIIEARLQEFEAFKLQYSILEVQLKDTTNDISALRDILRKYGG